MSECGVCGRIVTDKDNGLACDGRCTKWHYCTCLGITCEQYQEIFSDLLYVCEQYNALKWSAIVARTKIRESPKTKCI